MKQQHQKKQQKQTEKEDIKPLTSLLSNTNSNLPWLGVIESRYSSISLQQCNQPEGFAIYYICHSLGQVTRQEQTRKVEKLILPVSMWVTRELGFSHMSSTVHCFMAQ